MDRVAGGTAEGHSAPMLHVAARDIPVPTSVSAQAQAMLSLGIVGPESQWAAADDAEGWKRLIAEREAAVMAMSGMVGGEFQRGGGGRRGSGGLSRGRRPGQVTYFGRSAGVGGARVLGGGRGGEGWSRGVSIGADLDSGRHPSGRRGYGCDCGWGSPKWSGCWSVCGARPGLS